MHSIYDLKTELSYTQALKEGARLTDKRNNQINKDSGAECLWANLKTGNGCGAPKGPRLPIFEKIYNKDNLEENLRTLQEEDNQEAAQQNMVYPQLSLSTFKPASANYGSYNVKYNF